MTKKILVVEDHEDNRKILRDLLTKNEFEVIEAADGLTGFQLTRSERPDLVIMDIQLPGVDGYETTRRIKDDEDLREIPVIVVTSYAMSGDETKAFEAGCNAYVAKPYSPRDLLSLVRQYLG